MGWRKYATARHTVWSAEWSFGAALCAKTLASAYEKAGNAQYATELRADVSSIREHVMKNITEGGLHNLEQDGGMMYANKRFFIPWGWYANEVQYEPTAFALELLHTVRVLHYNSTAVICSEPPHALAMARPMR